MPEPMVTCLGLEITRLLKKRFFETLYIYSSLKRGSHKFRDNNVHNFFRLQFDEFQIVSSSHDDTILIWDFLNCNPPER